jgi:hypothetical protein
VEEAVEVRLEAQRLAVLVEALMAVDKVLLTAEAEAVEDTVPLAQADRVVQVLLS